jgi:Domain of unknown function (DUF1877)
MSIIAYYVHVDEPQLQIIREQPAIVWNVKSDPRFAKAALLDIDKDYEVVSWLLSAKKRDEQARQVANFRAINHKIKSGVDLDKEKFAAVEAEELKKLGIRPDGPEVPSDPFIEALEGHGTEAQRDPRINFGMGNARVFSPSEVKKIADAFERTGAADLRKNFNRKEMDKFEVGGMSWLDEPDSVFDRFILPAFQKVRSFFITAGKLKHHLLVFYQ